MSTTVPVWVFAVLAGLIALGYRQARTRVVAPDKVALVAGAMLLFSLYGVIAAFGAQLVPLLAWAAGIAVAIALGGRALAPRGLELVGQSVRIPGSWLPFWLLMGIFAAKFVLGFANGTGSHITQELWFQAVASLAFGAFSGGFSARALAVHRFARQLGAT